VVAASTAAGFASEVVVILGLANLIADGFSMGSSSFLSVKSERKKKNAPVKKSLATFLAFVMVGFVPVLPYLLDVVTDTIGTDSQALFIASGFLTALMFLWVGVAKSRHSRKALWRSMLETFSLGIAAASIAYFVGAILKDLFGV